jgi:membrane-bound metal-dependent hydrolase YbcI (DUF457 family)
VSVLSVELFVNVFAILKKKIFKKIAIEPSVFCFIDLSLKELVDHMFNNFHFSSLQLLNGHEESKHFIIFHFCIASILLILNKYKLSQSGLLVFLI